MRLGSRWTVYVPNVDRGRVFENGRGTRIYKFRCNGGSSLIEPLLASPPPPAAVERGIKRYCSKVVRAVLPQRQKSLLGASKRSRRR